MSVFPKVTDLPEVGKVGDQRVLKGPEGVYYLTHEVLTHACGDGYLVHEEVMIIPPAELRSVLLQAGVLCGICEDVGGYCGSCDGRNWLPTKETP